MTLWRWVLVWCFSLSLAAKAQEEPSWPSPDQVLSTAFPDAVVENVNVLITAEQAAILSEKLGFAVQDKVYTFFKAKKADKVIGYGALLTQRVRTKEQTAVYILSAKGQLQQIEVVSFNEPPEYTPKKDWLAKFKGQTPEKNYRLNQEIPIVSSATLTTQSFYQSARLILAVWQLKLK